MTKVLNHEVSYKKRGIASVIHRNRLSLIKELFDRFVNKKNIAWADFGCSSGFIIEEVVREGVNDFSKIKGYDHSHDLLSIARDKGIKNTSFDFIDMNQVAEPNELFGLVTCFETLEHVGDLESAINNIINYAEVGATVIITIPNETGLPGLVKLFARSILRSNAYDDFFDDKSYLTYSLSLLLNKRIEGYRKSGMPGYGPHLGFDYRKYEDIISDNFIDSGKLVLKGKGSTNFKMNLFYVYEKIRN